MVNLSLQLKPELKQILAMVLSPRMLQMLNVLQLPYVDLLKKIDEESEKNVMLEVEKKDELIEYLKRASKESPLKKESLSSDEAPDIDSLGDKHLTLNDYLLKQLDLEKLNLKEKKIGEYLIQSLDKRGYLIDFQKVKAEIEKKLKVSSFLIKKILKIIQTFEPEGVGGRDLKECLQIQIREHNFENQELKNVLEKAVSKHLEDLGNKKFEKIAQSLNIPPDGVASIAEFIKHNLNPNPGSKFSKKSEIIIPSYAIEEKDGRFTAVNLEEAYGPSVRLSSQYLKMLENPQTDAHTLEFLKTKLENAKHLLESIRKRYETSHKILELIVSTQEDFFQKGAVWLKPLSQKTIAEKVGVHASTISRALAGKYIETPKGVYALKYLCPRQTKGHSSEKIKNSILGLINHEDKNAPYSDDNLKEILKQYGIEIERRTIAAYRKELEIPASFNRSKP